MIIASINGLAAPFLPAERDVFQKVQDVFSQIENLTRGHVVQPRARLGRCLFRSRCGQLAIFANVDEE